MKVSFKGSIKRMTEKQEEFFAKLVEKLKKQNKTIEFHFGDSRGADESAFDILLKYDLVNKFVIHPSKEDDLRVFTEKKEYKSVRIKVLNAAPTFSRNHKLVDISDIIILTPEHRNDRDNSETSSIIRYCKTRKKKFITIFPDGLATKWPTTKTAPLRPEID